MTLNQHYTMLIKQYVPSGKLLYNTKLNDLRKIISLRNSKVYVKKKTVSTVIEKLVEDGIHCLPYSYINDVLDLKSH